MSNLYKFFYVLWSLTARKNRKRFRILYREYLGGLDSRASKQEGPLPKPVDPPYDSKTLQSGTSRKILLVIHQFSRTGAPYAVLYLARALFSFYGIRPIVISPQDGPIREEFEQEGFRTIVDPLLFSYKKYQPEVFRFIASFERIIVTSLASHSFINFFRGVGKCLTWWIHDTDMGFNSMAGLKVDLSLLFAVCESVWLGSPLSFPLASQYASQEKLHLLLYGCADTVIADRPHKSGKIVFSIVGTVEKRKGQDIFLDAVERLSDKLRSKAIFRIIGSAHPCGDSGNFYQGILARASCMSDVECYENMPPNKLQEFYAETNVLVCASRDDPMPIVITQGLMFSRVCICSSAIGHAQILKDGENGLIFSNESVDDLSQKMSWVLQHPTELSVIGTAGRKIYEQYFLMSSFVKNVGELTTPINQIDHLP